MVYVPEEWIVNPMNEKEIYRLLNSLHGDLHIGEYYDNQKKFVLAKLAELGETKILQEFKTGFFKP